MFFVVVQKGHCLSQNNGVESLDSTSVHVSIQVIELQNYACLTLMYGTKLILWFYKNGGVYTNFTMPVFFCVSPISMTSPSFRCWSIPVSEIREFNRKKKKNPKKWIFSICHLLHGQPFLVFDGIVTMMSLEVKKMHI